MNIRFSKCLLISNLYFVAAVFIIKSLILSGTNVLMCMSFVWIADAEFHISPRMRWLLFDVVGRSIGISAPYRPQFHSPQGQETGNEQAKHMKNLEISLENILQRVRRSAGTRLWGEALKTNRSLEGNSDKFTAKNGANNDEELSTRINSDNDEFDDNGEMKDVKVVQPLDDNGASRVQASSKLDRNNAISAAAQSTAVTAHSSEFQLTASEELLLIQTQHALQSARMTAAREREDAARALDREEHKTIARTLNRMIGILSALLNAFLFLMAIAEMFFLDD